jgi:hypothetical protein
MDAYIEGIGFRRPLSSGSEQVPPPLMPLARLGSLKSGTPLSFNTRLLRAKRTRQPSGGGSREADCDEGAALKRSGRVKEPEEATESILAHAPIPFAASAGFVDLTGVDPQVDEVSPTRAGPVASAALHPCGAACRLAVSLRSAPLFPIVEPSCRNASLK